MRDTECNDITVHVLHSTCVRCTFLRKLMKFCWAVYRTVLMWEKYALKISRNNFQHEFPKPYFFETLEHFRHWNFWTQGRTEHDLPVDPYLSH
jgi:hypothetical protein